MTGEHNGEEEKEENTIILLTSERRKIEMMMVMMREQETKTGIMHLHVENVFKFSLTSSINLWSLELKFSSKIGTRPIFHFAFCL